MTYTYDQNVIDLATGQTKYIVGFVGENKVLLSSGVTVRVDRIRPA